MFHNLIPTHEVQDERGELQNAVHNENIGSKVVAEIVPEEGYYDNDGDENHAIIAARHELEQLRATGAQKRNLYFKELKQHEHRYNDAIKRLHDQFCNLERESRQLYMSQLKEVFGNYSLPPVYVLRQQAQLGYAMHVSFSLHQRQISLIQEHERRMASFFNEQMTIERNVNKLREEEKLDDVTSFAANNQALYDEYEGKVDDQEAKLEKIRSFILSAARCDSPRRNEVRDDNDCSHNSPPSVENRDEQHQQQQQSIQQEPQPLQQNQQSLPQQHRHSGEHGQKAHSGLKSLAQSWTKFVRNHRPKRHRRVGTTTQQYSETTAAI